MYVRKTTARALLQRPKGKKPSENPLKVYIIFDAPF